METNQDKSVKAAKGSSTKTEDSGEIEATEESPQSIEEQEEIEETLEAPEVPKETAEEETELEELPEEDIVEESEDITREPEAEDILEEEFEEEETRKIEKKEEIDEEIVEERIYTIPLRRAWISSRQKRTPRAVRLVKAFVQRHMKPETLVMSNEVNERLWRRSIQKPPRKIRVRAARDKEGTVTLYLAEGD
ncbi:MAG: 60S ribosomal protein L31 [Candidatus Bathyarchaeota archaeon]|nr:60S ribosomal protein L31 [Candidatus Bathyarchaeota archaeon]